MPGISDNSLLSQLIKEDNAAFERLHKDCFPIVAKYVKQNSGSRQDAEDIFQEAIIVLLNNIRHPGFQLTASLKTYLFSISKNLWLKKLRAGRPVTIADEYSLVDLSTD